MISVGLFGETSENPVRARRREARKILLILPEATFRDKPLDLYLRRPVRRVPSRNIRTSQNPSVIRLNRTASAGLLEGNKI